MICPRCAYAYVPVLRRWWRRNLAHTWLSVTTISVRDWGVLYAFDEYLTERTVDPNVTCATQHPHIKTQTHRDTWYIHKPASTFRQPPSPSPPPLPPESTATTMAVGVQRSVQTADNRVGKYAGIYPVNGTTGTIVVQH